MATEQPTENSRARECYKELQTWAQQVSPKPEYFMASFFRDDCEKRDKAFRDDQHIQPISKGVNESYDYELKTFEADAPTGTFYCNNNARGYFKKDSLPTLSQFPPRQNKRVRVRTVIPASLFALSDPDMHMFYVGKTIPDDSDNTLQVLFLFIRENHEKYDFCERYFHLVDKKKNGILRCNDDGIWEHISEVKSSKDSRIRTVYPNIFYTETVQFPHRLCLCALPRPVPVRVDFMPFQYITTGNENHHPPESLPGHLAIGGLNILATNGRRHDYTSLTLYCHDRALLSPNQESSNTNDEHGVTVGVSSGANDTMSYILPSEDANGATRTVFPVSSEDLDNCSMFYVDHKLSDFHSSDVLEVFILFVHNDRREFKDWCASRFCLMDKNGNFIFRCSKENSSQWEHICQVTDEQEKHFKVHVNIMYADAVEFLRELGEYSYQNLLKLSSYRYTPTDAETTLEDQDTSVEEIAVDVGELKLYSKIMF